MSAEAIRPRPRLDDGAAALAVHVTVTALIGFLVTMLWGLTRGGEFWPRWVWFGILVALAVHAALWWTLRCTPARHGRALAVHAALTGVVAGVLCVLWLLTGRHGVWPAIALLGPAAILGTHAVGRDVWLRRGGGAARERVLTERVDELTRTRRSALEAQAAELRRLERTLHDGAQSHLVTLSMKLGMAEMLLAGQPEVAGLLRSAHDEARVAIAELRDLARGIAPPILTDRGLTAAVEALAERAVGEVTVETDLERRPAPVLEGAVYVVVCEALANAARHAPGAAVHVTLSLQGERLVARVADDGPGGADPAGSGLTLLRHRVEALDGTLAITSSPDGTTIAADLPCPRIDG
jgi:signal transduction histidine kinase